MSYLQLPLNQFPCSYCQIFNSILFLFSNLHKLELLFFYKFIYLFLAVLGLRCCALAFSSYGERGLLFAVVCGILITVASLCCGAWALGAQASVVVARGLSSCGSRP